MSYWGVIAIVTGSRDWTDRGAIWQALADLPSPSIVFHGAARGADAIADEMARDLRHSVETFPADWRRHGKSAGPRRNRYMRDAARTKAKILGVPVVCLAFPLPSSIGTLDMIALCEAEGWEVRLFEPSPRPGGR